MAMDGYRGFLALLVSALLVGFLSVIFTLIWVLHYREGLGWDGTGLEFNWHPVLLVTGFVFIQGIACSWFSCFPAAVCPTFAASISFAHPRVLWAAHIWNSDRNSTYGNHRKADFCSEKYRIQFIPTRRNFCKYPGPSHPGIRSPHFLDRHQTTMEAPKRTNFSPSSAQRRFHRGSGRRPGSKLGQQWGQIGFRVKQ
ncbi:plasma membrane ascorbate-dependent reductase CYBRD1 isoform X2 [Tenrec ecaudatus]|uniref:plasma membrane ascorbate-dependent reductase CYBRD1 isoform X2 n=1 Tax=Tenrec ecaudatus TaxID=94439 RepID=UPI003F59D40D